MSELRDEIARLKHRLQYLEERAANGQTTPLEAVREQKTKVLESERLHVAWSHAALRFRRQRDRVFDGLNLFGEPAWDILLELVLAQASQKRMSVNEASIASAVPATTALRHINLLNAAGLLVTSSDPLDRRRRWLELSSLGSTLMREALVR